jgi:hypothetical protein
MCQGCDHPKAPAIDIAKHTQLLHLQQQSASSTFSSAIPDSHQAGLELPSSNSTGLMASMTLFNVINGNMSHTLGIQSNIKHNT